MNPFILNSRDQLWFASSGCMAQLPWPGEMVYYFPKGHSQHMGAENADYLGEMVGCLVSAITLQATPDTLEPFAEITLVPCIVDPSNCQGNSNICGLESVVNPLSFKFLSVSDVNSCFAVLKHCVNTIFPPLDSCEEQIIHAHDIHGKTWDFRHIFKASQSQDLLRGEWRTFVKEKKPKHGDSIVFMRAEADSILLGIVKKISSMATSSMATSSMATSISQEVLESGVPIEVTYYPRAGPQFCVGVSDVLRALEFPWAAGMRFKKAFEMENNAAGIEWFHGIVTSVTDDNWNCLEVQWYHSDRNEHFVSPWTVEFIPTSLPHQPPSLWPRGPRGPDSQNSAPVAGVGFLPKHQILRGETSRFREEHKRQADCQRESDESALLIIDDTQQDMICALAELESGRQPLFTQYNNKTKEVTMGIMQILAKTAEWLVREVGCQAYGVERNSNLLYGPFINNEMTNFGQKKVLEVDPFPKNPAPATQASKMPGSGNTTWDSRASPEDMEGMWNNPTVSKEWHTSGEKKGKVRFSLDGQMKPYLSRAEMKTVLCALAEIVSMRFVNVSGACTGLTGIDYPTACWLYKDLGYKAYSVERVEDLTKLFVSMSFGKEVYSLLFRQETGPQWLKFQEALAMK
ncbi:auxin response factor 8-like isoform X2 [Cornus florida]|nr:auxin response factor 8-like isoform X2 [Cornus florida]